MWGQLTFSRHMLRIRPSSKPSLPCLFYSQWTSKLARSSFIEFFQQRGHEYFPPSSVIPKKGSGTFFTNAGMNQFKPIFLGTVTEGSPLSTLKRAVNSQKCIRLSGKHNDLDEVGFDCSHHTFFEMLGSWSFGDYFKRDAICMAWELLTQVFMIPEDRLYVTYFSGDTQHALPPDLESRDLWLEQGLREDRVLPGSFQDNFWEMGSIGPCGPSTEIHYDFIGGRDASHLVNTGDADVVELWNLVFMQYNRLGEREMEPLPSHHVDTGLGLERLVSVLQGKNSNYDTDLFIPIMKSISQSSQCGEYTGTLELQKDISYRIVSDHMRMISVCIADSILPGNQGQDGLSVKLRQIMHRSFQHQRKYLNCLPMTASMFVDPVIETLGEAFPEIAHNQDSIKETIQREEDLYYESLSDASSLLSIFTHTQPSVQVLRDEEIKLLRGLSRDLELPSLEVLSEVVDDYGLTLDVDLSTDLSTPQPMHTGKISGILASQIAKQAIPPTDDSIKYERVIDPSGQYNWLSCEGKVLAVSVNDMLVESVGSDSLPSDSQSSDNSPSDSLPSGSPPSDNSPSDSSPDIWIITDKTCFYAESGGQVADVGFLVNDRCQLKVVDVQGHGQHVLHRCLLESGSVILGDVVEMRVDQERRTDCSLNHTATHLLGHALRSVLGRAVQQAGSTISSDELTFSFTHQGDLSLNQLSAVSLQVNKQIADSIDLLSTDVEFSAVADIKDIIKLPTHQYPSKVRVVSAGPLNSTTWNEGLDFSAELCGGTHAANTRDLQDFVITGLTGQRQGVKRLTAVTGAKARAARQLMAHLQALATYLMADISSKSNVESWTTRLKEINKIYGCEAERLPKVERDILLKRLKTSRTSEVVKRREKEASLTRLEEAIAKIIEEASSTAPFILTQIDFGYPKDAVKVLGQLNSSVPVFLYKSSRPDARCTEVVIYCPAHHEDKVWVDAFTALGTEALATSSKHGADILTLEVPYRADDVRVLIKEFWQNMHVKQVPSN
ncbi:alanine--tRNA ligase, cytoplasmic-like [Watersipora subatra]|uniref:alanine--tRNA ligase, cytoplasmic-like n=1 Tax=Watersipora subatra TaxID=2589382 RepID=UPI00355BD157